jgi:hypothetical protein
MYARKASEGEQGEDKELLINIYRTTLFSHLFGPASLYSVPTPLKTSKSKSSMYKKKTYQKKHQ